MAAAIHQLVAGFSRGDAISNEALALQNAFRSWGARSCIFCEAKRILPELRGTARDLREMSYGPDDIALLHLSIGSAVNDFFAGLRCRKAILYHNVTPPAFYKPINSRTAADLERGLRQVKALAGAAELNMAVSGFNAAELVALGYRDVKVLPLTLDLGMLDAPPDKTVAKRYGDGRVNVIFVGRLAPNKAIEDLVTAFAHYRHCVQPRSRLIHVGSFAGAERYYQMVRKRAQDMGVGDTVFAGAVPQNTLNAFYRIASVFLCMSEHEGFCIPIIEAMHMRVPVLAYAGGAVPETLDGAGVLFREKKFPWIAEMIEMLASDLALRRSVIERQDARVGRYTARDTVSELRALMRPLMEKGGR